MILLLFSGSYHSLWLFPCIATFPYLQVTITGVNATSLCFSVPTSDFDCFAALSFRFLPSQDFSSCDEREHLLIFPTTIQRTYCFSVLFQID
jgi:hypothetical protein